MKTMQRSIGVFGAVLCCGMTLCLAQSSAQSNYIAKCQACHGATGAGDTPTGKMLSVKSFADPQVVSLTDDSLTGTLSNGAGKMPAFKNIYSGDQISALVQYLHQLQTSLQAK